MPSLKIKRGTRAQLDAAIASSQLKQGEPYLITDEGRLAVGTAVNAYQALAKQGEGGITLSRIRYVAAAGGNDGTAVAGDIAHPYATVRAAVDAAAEGDAVMLLPGSHACTNPPLVLKNNVALAGYGVGVSRLTFDGLFHVGTASGTGTSTHGGCIQPATGTPFVQRCEIRNLSIDIDVAADGRHTSIFGLNTAVGNATTGTGTSYIDMDVFDCDIDAFSDVHFVIDAKQHTRFKRCRLRSAYDFVHLIGPNHIAHAVIDQCVMISAPWFDGNTFVGTAPDSISRVRSGSLTLTDTDIVYYNDGTSNWSLFGGSLVNMPAGLVVDHVAGAKIIAENIRWHDLAPFPVPMQRFGSNAPVGTPSLGTVIVRGDVAGLLDYNSGHFAHKSPPRIMPAGTTVLRANIFAAAAASATKNNTYRCSQAATAQTFNLFTLPPGAKINAVWLDCRATFTGGASSAVTAELGTAAQSNAYLIATDIRSETGVVDANVALQSIETGGDPYSGTGTLVTATVRTTGANVNTLTAGDLYVYVELAGHGLGIV